jgi:transcriptional regulator with XRE-family HTH domain
MTFSLLRLLNGVRPGLYRQDSVTFSKLVRYYTMTLPRPIVPPKGYPVPPVTIGEHLRKRRLDLGLLQSQVAERIGVTPSTVWNWEHGRLPKPRHQAAISQILHEGSHRYLSNFSFICRSATWTAITVLKAVPPAALFTLINRKVGPAKNTVGLVTAIRTLTEFCSHDILPPILDLGCCLR